MPEGWSTRTSSSRAGRQRIDVAAAFVGRCTANHRAGLNTSVRHRRAAGLFRQRVHRAFMHQLFTPRRTQASANTLAARHILRHKRFWSNRRRCHDAQCAVDDRHVSAPLGACGTAPSEAGQHARHSLHAPGAGARALPGRTSARTWPVRASLCANGIAQMACRARYEIQPFMARRFFQRPRKVPAVMLPSFIILPRIYSQRTAPRRGIFFRPPRAPFRRTAGGCFARLFSAANVVFGK